MSTPNENVPAWQFNTIPGNANQGSILMTRNDITDPPFNQSDFIWKAMEDIIGTADVKLDYDEETNIYTLSKAVGHRDNDGNWTYDWTVVGTWNALTNEVVEILRSLAYVEYVYDTSVANTLKVYGVKKDGTRTLLVDIAFATTQYVDQAISNLKNITTDAPLVYHDSGNIRTIGIKLAASDFIVNSDGTLQTNLIVNSSSLAIDKTFSAYYITQTLLKNKFNYVGDVQDKIALPSGMDIGSVYKVANEEDLYVYLGPVVGWYPFTYIAESFNAYAIELHKEVNGLYAKLRYDTVDFTIDSFLNLKSQLIDDSMDASDPLSNRKTYSINKILSLLTSIYRYKGQVDYYDLLPTTGLIVGDCYNVKYVGTSVQGSTELDGDNYAWDGTDWDDLSGEYRAGSGIVINGKTISATGISFNIGDGLQATGSGSTTTLQTRITNGIEYVNIGTTANPVNALGTKAGSGVTVNAAGVNVNTGQTTQTINDNIEVKPHNGLVISANGLDINANFAIKDTPLGTDGSKLALYSDGKIAVDFTESPVVLTGELLYSGETGSTFSLNIGTVNHLNEYDMIGLSIASKVTATGVVSTIAEKIMFKTTDRQINWFDMGNINGDFSGATTGIQARGFIFKNVNMANSIIGSFSEYVFGGTAFGGSGNWIVNSTSTGSAHRVVKIYGIKAR